MNRKLLLTLIIFMAVVVAATFFIAPVSKVKQVDGVMTSSKNIEELKTNPTEARVLDSITDGRIAPASKISVSEFQRLEARSKELRIKMSELAQELDKHLDDKERRKRIEAKNIELTKEYNDLAIKLVKAGRPLDVSDSN